MNEAQTLEPLRDENGVAILPGYRKPFAKGNDPRRLDLKAYRATLPPAPKAKRQSNRLLAAIRKSFYAYCKSARDCANDPTLALGHAKVAKMFFDMEQTLSGSRRNSTKNHSLQLSTIAPIPRQKVEPIAPTKSPTITPQSPDQSAPQVKPGGKVSPVSSDSDSDCPF